MYKALVNCFESCLFTYKISNAMTMKIIWKNIILLMVFLSVSYWGYLNNEVGLAIFQVFISSIFLKELIEHLRFVNITERIFEDLKEFFTSNKKDDSFGEEKMGFAIKTLLDYETNLAYASFLSDSNIYNSINKDLTKEWTEMKLFYNIEDFDNHKPSKK